jgi:hypothetical protein
MSTFLYLGSSQIINDTPPPKKTRKIPLLMQFLMPSFVQTRLFVIFLSATGRIKDQTLLRYS